MRILVVGAGGIGGYFGARLQEAGRDVTFLVRPRRAAELARTGLCVRSAAGDITIAAPKLVTSETTGGPYDLIVLSCKAYDLEGAIDSLAPAMGPNTAILPLLNGMAHLDALDARFGAGRVLGGLCLISAALDPHGHILHLGEPHALSFGERLGGLSARSAAILAQLEGAKFAVRASDVIVQEMWEKWVFIATAAGLTAMMRATIGDIVGSGGADIATDLLAECSAIAGAAGFAPRKAASDRAVAMFTAAGSPLTASLARDIERGGAVESEQILGDLLRRAPRAAPILRIAYGHLKAYEARRAREATL